jgi:dihydropyrimidinase
MTFDTIIRGGTLLTPAGPVVADLGIVGEQIAAIGLGLDGARVIDASGQLVLPGAIDPHVHLEMPAGPVRSSDDWQTGTIAAACGGTTTVIDFAEPEDSTQPSHVETGQGGGLLTALAARRAEAEGRAVVDFGLHMTLRDAGPATLAEIPAVVAAGCPSFKTYMTYSFKLADEALLAALEAVVAAGGLVLVHAENDAGIAHLQRRFLSAGYVAPRYHPRSRPAGLEAEAIERALALAEVAGCPLYVVHISTARGAEAVARARARGQAVCGETCPQYLLLTEAEYERPGFEGAKFVCSPPLRTTHDNAVLWRLLAADGLQTVGTDHCPFFYRGQKDLRDTGQAFSPPAFNRIPGGMPGIEARLALLYTFGVRTGRLSLERWIEVCCTAPARVFGLYPRKGALVPGADADIVIFDPARAVTLSPSVLHEHCDYTPYEGLQLRGYPVLTMLRGRVIVRAEEFVGQRGGGRFLHRELGEADNRLSASPNLAPKNADYAAPVSDFARRTAELASGPKPSAPICFA